MGGGFLENDGMMCLMKRTATSSRIGGIQQQQSHQIGRMLKGEKSTQKHLSIMSSTIYRNHGYFNLQFNHLVTCVMLVKDFLIFKLRKWGT